MEFKKVEKDVFDEFVSTYPRPLDWDVTGICEPPLGSYNDFELADKWPDSIVAKVKMYDGSGYHDGKGPEFYIRADI